MARSSRRPALRTDAPAVPESSPPPFPAEQAAEGRDLVFFFSRLTRTLETACGGDAVATRLADSRRDAPPGGEPDSDAPAIGRSLRRLGVMRPDQESGEFIPGFVRRLAGAVSRSERHVLSLLRLFAAGDEKRGVKAICGPTPQCGGECRLARECDFFNTPRKPAVARMTPVERLLSGNAAAMSDAELLALCLHGDRGTGREPAVETLLARYGGLRDVFRADPREYGAVRGMTRSQTVRLASQAALYRRLLAERRDARRRIGSARDIHDRYAPELRECRTEITILLMLDQRQNVIRDAWFADASPSAAPLGVADLLRPALGERAARIALVRNRPSGDPAPSGNDRAFTRLLSRACRIFGLILTDHVLVGENGYFSFRDAGLLDAPPDAPGDVPEENGGGSFRDPRAPGFPAPHPGSGAAPTGNRGRRDRSGPASFPFS